VPNYATEYTVAPENSPELRGFLKISKLFTVPKVFAEFRMKWDCSRCKLIHRENFLFNQVTRLHPYTVYCIWKSKEASEKADADFCELLKYLGLHCKKED
jgi:hypothetical protein